MELKEAIETLNKHQIQLKTIDDHDCFAAIILGIEALKFYKGLCEGLPPGFYPLLPGETKEEERR